jgi:ABC-type multidrug transport system ATPase subunit
MEAFSFQLLSNQKFILFADDPLSGLDSLSSYMLVETLQRLANSGYTILCTLDQPTSDVYALFNKYVHEIQSNSPNMVSNFKMS